MCVCVFPLPLEDYVKGHWDHYVFFFPLTHMIHILTSTHHPRRCMPFLAHDGRMRLNKLEHKQNVALIELFFTSLVCCLSIIFRKETWLLMVFTYRLDFSGKTTHTALGCFASWCLCKVDQLLFNKDTVSSQFS